MEEKILFVIFMMKTLWDWLRFLAVIKLSCEIFMFSQKQGICKSLLARLADVDVIIRATKGGYVTAGICLFGVLQNNSKNYEQTLIAFSGNLNNGSGTDYFGDVSDSGRTLAFDLLKIKYQKALIIKQTTMLMCNLVLAPHTHTHT